VAFVVNALGVLAVAGVLFFRQYYDFVIYYCMGLALLVVILPIFFKMLRLTDGATAYPNISVALFTSAGSLFFRSIFDFDIYDYSKLWPVLLPVGVIFSLLTILTGRIHKEEGQKRLRALIQVQIFAFIFSYGSIVMLNCMHDTSDTQHYSTLVLDKWIHHTKMVIKNYDLSLAPWGTVADTEPVSVPEVLYDRIEPGQKVNIYVKQGRLGIPWFVVTD
jgi:hypothetical protein